MNLSSNIFEDLEISTKGFIDSAENVEEFAKRVLAVADELNDIMSANTSVTDIERKAELEFETSQEFQTQLHDLFDEPLDAMYEACEELPLPVVYGFMKMLEKLSKDLRNTLHDRAKREFVDGSAPIQSKKLAHTQYTRLRENFEHIRKFAELMYGVKLKGLPAKPGNYAPSLTKTYAFIFNDSNEPFYNPRTVAKKLGIHYDGILLMDILEYCEKHPEEVTVKEVDL